MEKRYKIVLMFLSFKENSFYLDIDIKLSLGITVIDYIELHGK